MYKYFKFTIEGPFVEIENNPANGKSALNKVLIAKLFEYES
jgi:hypothetical protein